MRTLHSWPIIGGLLIVGIVFGPGQQRLAQWWYEHKKPTELPIAVPVDKPDNQTTIESVNDAEQQTTSEPDEKLSTINYQLSTDSVLEELNLAVPFTSQAPLFIWDATHEEYCEEASALMVGRYFQGRGIDDPADADQAMGELAAWETENLGTFTSTTADETARMIREVYGLDVTLSTNVNELLIKQALVAGQLIVLPAAGRELGNPYFKRPGPIYHMLVVKGYTSDGRFITNDPGTKRGADFVYKPQILIDAVGDWNNGDPAQGQKVMLVIDRPSSS